MELPAAPKLTIRPLRDPLDSAAPIPRNRELPFSISAISAHALVLPISSAARSRSFFPTNCSFRSTNHPPPPLRPHPPPPVPTPHTPPPQLAAGPQGAVHAHARGVHKPPFVSRS